MSDHSIHRTNDGSHTIHSEQFDASYHSRHGALTESLHVFIKHGLSFLFQKKEGKEAIRLIECGFGTGLNAWLTAVLCLQNERSVHYIGVEPHPLPSEHFRTLNFARLYEDGQFMELWKQMHRSVVNSTRDLHDYFSFEVHPLPIQQIEPETSIDLIYHDAFGPRVQADLWDRPLLERYFNWLNTSGILVTFGAQGAFKRQLDALGFEVETLAGPPGKREMTRAIKPR